MKASSGVGGRRLVARSECKSRAARSTWLVIHRTTDARGAVQIPILPIVQALLKVVF
jgi:hypothetical protein